MGHLPVLPEGYEFAAPYSIGYLEYSQLMEGVAGYKPRTERAWQSWSGRVPVITGIVEVEADELVGFGAIESFGSRRHFLTNLAVHPEHRHQGLGQALVKARVDYADTLELGVLLTSLAPTNTLGDYYASLGFVPEATSDYLVRYYGALA